MSYQKDRAIILQLHPYRETSLIVRCIAESKGLLSLVAKGVHRSRSAFRGRLDLFFLCDLTFASARSEELATLTEVSVIEPFLRLRLRIDTLSQASWIAYLILRCFEPATPAPSVFKILKLLLYYLCEKGPDPNAVALAELTVLQELGLLPISSPDLSPSIRQALALVSNITDIQLGRLTVPTFSPGAHRLITSIFEKEFNIDPRRRQKALGLSLSPESILPKMEDHESYHGDDVPQLDQRQDSKSSDQA